MACDAVPGDIASGQWGLTMDTATTARRLVVLMGGGSEDDAAAREFVTGAQGGDVLVLRASGSVDSYTAYFGTELAAQPAPASVTTLRLETTAASLHPAVLCRRDAAEALWLAGGDQWDYLGLWDVQLAQHAANANRAVGGTSAGAMVLGAYAFTAQYGSVTSPEALADPTGMLVAVAPSAWAQPELGNVVVDTHFTQRGREGRLLAFTAHLLDSGVTTAWGLGLDEDTALTIVDGTATVGGAGDVWLYRVTGPVTAWMAGVPLGLDGITRTRLAPGTSIPWPPAAAVGNALRVINGDRKSVV